MERKEGRSFFAQSFLNCCSTLPEARSVDPLDMVGQAGVVEMEAMEVEEVAADKEVAAPLGRRPRHATKMENIKPTP